MAQEAPAASALARSPENLMPPSAITGTSGLGGGLDRLHDGGELRHADARDDARRADRARADADLDGVGAGVDQRLGALARRHVAGDHLDGVRELLHPASTLSSTRTEWPWAVSTTITSQPASIRRSERSKPLLARRRRGGDPQPALLVLGGVRIGDLLLDVLDGDQADAAEMVVDDEQLLDAELVQEAPRLVLRRRPRAR